MLERYLPRIVDRQLDSALMRLGAVLVRGAKWCGKTSTAERHAKSEVSLLDPRQGPRYRQLAATDPLALLTGETPLLIDEWQLAPELWDAVRYEVDRRHQRGLFILTGSAVPRDDLARHTGTGRIGRVTMRPMTLAESGDSSGTVSLSALFEDIRDPEREIETLLGGSSSLTIEDLAFLACRGGWPEPIADARCGDVGPLAVEAALTLPFDYLDAIVESDISRVDGARRDPALARSLLRSMARFSAQSAKIPTIQADLASNGMNYSDKTVQTYLGALRRIFVLEPLDPWSPRMRSKTAIRKAPTWYFTDPSIACAALSASPERLMEDLETFGFIFETLCVRDLRVYAEAMGGRLAHFRDRNGLEVDTIVALRDGRWAAIEIKLGSAAPVDHGAATLAKFRSRLDEGTRPPEFSMVITGSGPCYRRPDGILVVPIGCLGP